MKMFLLIAGDNYYPGAGTEDWIDTFNSAIEAREEVKTIRESKGWRLPGRYEVRGQSYDWFDIVDLNTWVSR